MRVDQPRQDEMRPMIDFLHALRRTGFHLRIVADGGNHAVLYQQPAVLLVSVAVRVGEGERRAFKGEQAAADQGLRHCEMVLSYQAVSSCRSCAEISVMLPGGMAWLRPAWM